MTPAEISRRFDPHKPATLDQNVNLDMVTLHFKSLVEYLCKLMPESRERSLAITKLEAANYWAKAAIVRPPTEKK